MKKSYSLKRKIALVLSLLMLFTIITGCSSKQGASAGSGDDQGAAGESEYQERIVIANSTVLTNNDPQATNTLVNIHINHMTHNTLFDFDTESQSIRGELAEEYEKVGDTTYEFKLRKGVLFHNGVEFTARDVAFTFEKAKEISYREPLVRFIKNIDIIDDYTIRIELTEDHQEFIQALTETPMSMLCEQACIDEGEIGVDKKPVYPQIGTGPYVLEEWLPRDYVLLKRNENYFGELPKTKEIEYKQYSEASAAVIALQTGEVDILIDPSEIELDNIAADSDLELIMGPAMNFCYMAVSMNGAGGRTLLKDNPELRRAIAYAINQEDIIKVVYNDRAVAPKGFLPEGVYGYLDDIKSYAYEYNPEKAKQILKEQGYESGLDLEVTYDVNRWQKMYEIIQAQLHDVGINLTNIHLESARYTEAVRSGDYDLIFASWAHSYAGIGLGLANIWSSDSGSNRMKVSDQQIDKYLEEGLVESDPEKRLQVYRDLQEYMKDFSAFVPLAVQTKYVAVRSGIEGIDLKDGNRMDFSYTHRKNN